MYTMNTCKKPCKAFLVKVIAFFYSIGMTCHHHQSLRHPLIFIVTTLVALTSYLYMYNNRFKALFAEN